MITRCPYCRRPCAGQPHAECVAKSRAQVSTWRSSQVKAGLCTQCGTGRRLRGHLHCADCADRAKNYWHDRKELLEQMGVCSRCKSGRAPGRRLCQACIDKGRARRAK